MNRVWHQSRSGGDLDAPREPGSVFDRWSILALACIVASLVLMLSMAVWGVRRDFLETRTKLLQADLNHLRSHAARSVSVLQNRLADKSKNDHDLSVLNDTQWLDRHWRKIVPSDPARLYSAVVASDGHIVLHSGSPNSSQNLDDNWIDGPVQGAGDDVFETHAAALSGGRRAFDIALPIYFNDREVGTYHSGFNCDWFDAQVSREQRAGFQRWALLLAGIALIAAVVCVSIYRVARRVTRRVTLLEQSVRLAHMRRLAEVGQLVAAVAHEIRNPLNAMRLNLHVLSKRLEALPASQQGDTTDIVRETTFDVRRIEELVQALVSYARPERAHAEDVDAAAEVQATVNVLLPSLTRARVVVRTHMADEPVRIHIDRNRLRQIVLNLLNNAKEAAGSEGTIDVTVSCAGERAEIEVCDTGPGIPADIREQIFEPFFTTKELGTGLGLPLVKRFVEEAGGNVSYQSNGTGSQFKLVFPVGRPPPSRESVRVA
ncbi:MAG TPA: HAMP domain-containing sensor histidine kinase [Pirellulales bacterium]|jgi:signal transduction histidine kinase|nr:HAMP domain-containing sensor histidine kinase [Pirellulales bacterium]